MEIDKKYNIGRTSPINESTIIKQIRQVLVSHNIILPTTPLTQIPALLDDTLKNKLVPSTHVNQIKETLVVYNVINEGVSEDDYIETLKNNLHELKPENILRDVTIGTVIGTQDLYIEKDIEQKLINMIDNVFSKEL
jgi:hypothetical protein